MRVDWIKVWLILAGLLPALTMADDSVIAVIVSAQPNFSVSVAASELAPVYWRKKLYDNRGKPLHPANLSTDHPLRLHFS